MKIKKVAILGAGAVGSYVLWGLSQKDDVDVCIIADGERKNRYEKDGLMINGERYNPQILTASEAKGADLIIVATKYNSLRGALPDIQAATDEHTIIMSLMNGVDSEEIISEVVPKEQIVYSLIKVASEHRADGVRFDPETTIGIIYGEINLSRGTDRVDAITGLFEGTGLHYRVTDDILVEMWTKYRLNVPNNQIQAIIGCGVGAYEDSKHAEYLRVKVRDELDEVAKAKGIDFSKADGSSNFGSKVKKRARYSTLQDLDAKRHTEVDMFSGAIIRMGKELGIPTPYNDFVYHMIKALEEKNDGLFDYSD